MSAGKSFCRGDDQGQVAQCIYAIMTPCVACLRLGALYMHGVRTYNAHRCAEGFYEELTNQPRGATFLKS